VLVQRLVCGWAGFERLIRRLMVLISSRRLFSNWLLAGVKYYLTRHGVFKGGIMVKCGGKKYVLSPWVYSSIVSAYYDGLLRDVSCSDNGFIGKLGGVIDLIIRDSNGLLRMPDGILLTLESFDSIVLYETWLYDIHFLGFDLDNWFVLDIGAYIGDTALYYARRGAFVVAVEPLSNNYDVMLRNIELNPDLKPRIVPMNIAVSGEDGFLDLSYNELVDGGATIYDVGRFKSKVKSMKLSTLVKEITGMGIDLSRFNVRVLKMDCKGCEYDVIKEVDVLRLFDIIKIEYSGYLRNKTFHELKEVIEALGFKCRVWVHNWYAIRAGLDRHGTITCARQGR